MVDTLQADDGDYAALEAQTAGVTMDEAEAEKSKYGAMTVNERLFFAGLIDQFDDAMRTRDRARLTEILLQVEIGDPGRTVDSMLDRRKLGNTGRAREHFSAALFARAGNYEGAVELLREGLAPDQTNADMLKFLADVLLNQVTAAHSALERRRGQQVPETDVRDEDAIRQAIEAYEKVLEIQGAPADPQILKNVIAAYLQLGNIQEASRFVERTEPQLPEDASLRSLKADIFARQEDYAGAVAAMDEALRLEPGLPQGLAKRGVFKLSAGDEQGAMGDFRAAVGVGENPDIIAKQMLSGGYEAYFQREQYDRATRVFKAALAFATEPATKQQIHYFTAFSYYHAGANIDTANEAEACVPARRALNRFQQVLPHLDQAANYRAAGQAELRAATDMQVYRQEAIVDKPACR